MSKGARKMSEMRDSEFWVQQCVAMCYAFNDYGTEGDKDQFYEKLQSIIRKRSEKDLIETLGLDEQHQVRTELWGRSANDEKVVDL